MGGVRARAAVLALALGAACSASGVAGTPSSRSPIYSPAPTPTNGSDQAIAQWLADQVIREGGVRGAAYVRSTVARLGVVSPPYADSIKASASDPILVVKCFGSMRGRPSPGNRPPIVSDYVLVFDLATNRSLVTSSFSAPAPDVMGGADVGNTPTDLRRLGTPEPLLVWKM